MRGPTHRVVLASLAALLALGTFVGSAQAYRPFMGIELEGTRVPPPALTSADRFEDACGVTVDSQGDIYVADYYHHAVDVFSTETFGPESSHSLITRIPGVAPDGGPCDLAVDSAGRLYVNSYHQGILRYTPSSFPFFGPPTYSDPVTIDPTRSTGVAVDPADNRLYVAHRNYVSVYEPDGSPVLAGSDPLQIGLGSLGDGYGVAVSAFAATSGFVYVADAEDGTVKVYDPATNTADPVEVVDGSGTPPGLFDDLRDAEVAVEAGSGHVFVVDNLGPGLEHPPAAVYEFDSSGSYLGRLPHPIVHAGPSAVAIGNGRIYVTSGNDEGAVVYGFGPEAPAQTLELTKAGSGEGRVMSTPVRLDCRASCSSETAEFDAGSQVTLTASAQAHSAFKGWSVAGQPGACAGTGTCKVTLAADATVTAEFEALPQRALQVTKTGAGNGRVLSTPAGIDCGPSCGGEFDRGTTVTLVANAVTGSEFTGWSGGGCSGTDSCTVVLGANVDVSAEFQPRPGPATLTPAQLNPVLAISVLGAGAGTIVSDPAGIDCGTPCAGGYPAGTTVTLTAQPDRESRFAGWSGCDVASGNSCRVTLRSSKTVSASFEESEPLRIMGVATKKGVRVLTVSAPGPGSISVSGKGLRPKRVEVRQAGPVSLPLALSASGRKALRAKGRASFKAKVAFRPSGGGTPVVLEKVIPFVGDRGKSGR